MLKKLHTIPLKTVNGFDLHDMHYSDISYCFLLLNISFHYVDEETEGIKIYKNQLSEPCVYRMNILVESFYFIEDVENR